MSYARTGKDSDVYVFGSKAQLEIWVAYNRGQAGNVPRPGARASEEEWNEFFRDIVPLDNENVGKTFIFNSREECVQKLEELRDSGLMVPQSPIERLRREAIEKGDRYSI